MHRYQARFDQIDNEISAQLDSCSDGEKPWAFCLMAALGRTVELLGSSSEVWDGDRVPNAMQASCISQVAESHQMATDLLANDEIRIESTLGRQLESLRLLTESYAAGRLRSGLGDTR